MIECLLIPLYITASIFVAIARPIILILFGIKIPKHAVSVFFHKHRSICIGCSVIILLILIYTLS